MTHKNIKVIGNTFKNVQCAIALDSVEGVEIKNNLFEDVEQTAVLTNCLQVDSDIE